MIEPVDLGICRGYEYQGDPSRTALVLPGRMLAGMPVNAYAIDVSDLTLANVLMDLIAGRGGTIESGELGIAESDGDRVLAAGRYGRWQESGARSQETE